MDNTDLDKNKESKDSENQSNDKEGLSDQEPNSTEKEDIKSLCCNMIEYSYSE